MVVIVWQYPIINSKQPRSCYIIKCSKSNKHPWMLVLHYNCSQTTKKFIRAYFLINIVKLIVKSLSPIYFYIQERPWPFVRIFLQTRYNRLNKPNQVTRSIADSCWGFAYEIGWPWILIKDLWVIRSIGNSCWRSEYEKSWLQIVKRNL